MSLPDQIYGLRDDGRALYVSPSGGTRTFRIYPHGSGEEFTFTGSGGLPGSGLHGGETWVLATAENTPELVIQGATAGLGELSATLEYPLPWVDAIVEAMSIFGTPEPILADEYASFTQSVLDQIRSIWPEAPDFTDSAAIARRVAGSQTDQLQNIAGSTAMANLQALPEVINTVLGQTVEATAALNAGMADDFYRIIEDLVPDWQETILGAPSRVLDLAFENDAQYRATQEPVAQANIQTLAGVTDVRAEQVLTGGLPSDLASRIATRFGDSSAQGDLIGGADLTGPALGRSLGEGRLLQLGVGLAQTGGAIRTAGLGIEQRGAQSAQALQAGAGRLLQATDAFTPPTTNANAMFDALLSVTGPTAITTMDQMFADSARTLQSFSAASVQFGQMDSETQWSGTLSGLGVMDNIMGAMARMLISE